MKQLSPETPPPFQIEQQIWLKALLLFFGSFLLYFLSRSPGLDEIDSINFAMGVGEYNLWKHQPQPPGYPLFVFLGYIGRILFGADANTALHFVSAMGGGLLVAAWFVTIRVQFNERLAWWVAGCLAVTPIVWMISTKVMTDTLASGLLSAQILAAVCFAQSGQRRWLIATGVLGAAAAAGRPGLALVVFVVLTTTLVKGPKIPRGWWIGWMTLVGSSLIWLIPLWYTQWRLRPPAVATEAVYPHLVYNYWAGRLHSPNVFLFAGKWTAEYLATRFVFHILGWFGLGFGFIQSAAIFFAGTAIALVGLAAYILGQKQPADGRFWRFHAPWALVHITLIFINVPAHQRYYLVIYPLLLVSLLSGYLRWRQPWNRLAWSFPALLLCVTIPCAIVNHRDPSPPLRFLHYLEELHPRAERGRVVLLLTTKVKRHAEWYAPEFVTINPIPPPEQLPELTKNAVAVYTDDPYAPLPPKWYRVPLVTFTRSLIVYWKGHYLELYLVERP